MKKILLVTSVAAGILLELASFDVFAVSTTPQSIGYWQDLNKNVIGYKIDIPNGHRDERWSREGKFYKNGWMSYYSIVDGNIFKLDPNNRETNELSVEDDFFYYKKLDCQGDKYLRGSSGGEYYPGDQNPILMSNSNIIKTKVLLVKSGRGEYYPGHSMPTPISDFDFRSISHLDVKGELICEALNYPKYEEGYMSKVKNIENLIENPHYRWLTFHIDSQDHVYATVKGVQPPFEYIDTGPIPVPDLIPYPSSDKDIKITVTSEGNLSSVLVDKGPDVFEGEISVKRINKGIYDITFPERILPHSKTSETVQLNCSVNKPSRNDGGNMGISCYKLDNLPVVRVVSMLMGYPSNTRFNLQTSW
ncbi:hypothetical protein C0W59_11995 [Photobacterium kishitanii]|uniref:hypothetical protein n=1 Tax=Photobacterium kishitanii TaxID=318456 RepID=UPI000D151524|nr:hypothetical protein [Photobacterium kishitanii]PSV15189.1 hypothetical protein C0W59_11995 [Photobacterium kishitanii]